MGHGISGWQPGNTVPSSYIPKFSLLDLKIIVKFTELIPRVSSTGHTSTLKRCSMQAIPKPLTAVTRFPSANSHPPQATTSKQTLRHGTLQNRTFLSFHLFSKFKLTSNTSCSVSQGCCLYHRHPLPKPRPTLQYLKCFCCTTKPFLEGRIGSERLGCVAVMLLRAVEDGSRPADLVLHGVTRLSKSCGEALSLMRWPAAGWNGRQAGGYVEGGRELCYLDNLDGKLLGAFPTEQGLGRESGSCKFGRNAHYLIKPKRLGWAGLLRPRWKTRHGYVGRQRTFKIGFGTASGSTSSYPSTG